MISNYYLMHLNNLTASKIQHFGSSVVHSIIYIYYNDILTTI